MSCAARPAKAGIAAWAFGARLLAAIAFCMCAAAPAQAIDLSRFVNLTDWFTWPRYVALDRPGVLSPAYDPARHQKRRADLKQIKRLGFRGIRLGVDPASFWVLDGPRKEQAWVLVFHGVQAALDEGLDVVLDLHPNSRHQLYGESAVIRGTDDAVFKSYVGVVAEFAERLSALPQDRVALELMNEPRLKCAGADQDAWNGKLDAMIGAARAKSASLPLVVTGSCVSAIEGLLALQPSRWADPNLVFTFHFYEPFVFTHQGAPFIRWPEKHLGGLPWPAAPRIDVDNTLALAEASLAQVDEQQRDRARADVRRVLQGYLASGAGRRLLDRRLALVAAWADRNSVPRQRIFLGEFGIYGSAPGRLGASCPDKVRWLRDMREAIDVNRFGWAFFHYDGPFGLVDDARPGQRQAMLGALGLSGDAPCPP